MKSRVLVVALILAAPLAAGQGFSVASSSKAQETLRRMFVQNGSFGFPAYAADPFTCAAATERATYYNTVSHASKICNGTAWVTFTGAGSGVVGPASSRDNGVVRFDGTTGLLLQDSGITLSDSPINVFAAVAPTAAASSQPGNPISLSASNATAGTSNAGAAAGGSVSIVAGNADRLTSGNADGGTITLTGGTGIGTGVTGTVSLNSASTFHQSSTAGSLTFNFIDVIGTLPAPTSNTYGAVFQMTGQGSSGTSQTSAVLHYMPGGYTGSGATFGTYSLNTALATSNSPFGAAGDTTAMGNVGTFGEFIGSTAGAAIGTYGLGANTGTGKSYGAFGNGNSNSGDAVGVVGVSTSGSAFRVGGYFGFNTTTPTFASTALLADNVAVAAPIFLGRDNGTQVFQIEDGGAVTLGAPGSGTNGAGTATSIGPAASTGTAAAADFVINRVPTTQASGSSLNTTVAATRIVSKAKTLTSASAAVIFSVTGLGAHKRTGGSFEFCVEAGDASNDQIACCRSQWAAIDTTAGAGGETCTNLLDKTCTAALEGAASTGTLAVTADTTTGTDQCNFRLTSTTSLTATTHQVTYRVTQNGTLGVIAPQ